MNKDLLQKVLRSDLTIITAKSNSGKSTLLRDLMDSLRKHFKPHIEVFGMGGHDDTFFSLLELEEIKNSFIFVDEVGLLFNLQDRKNKIQIEKVMRLINHNNNKLVLSGLPTDFKKFITAKANTFMFKSLNKQDLVNGSETKNILNQYKGVENGVLSFQLPIDEALVYTLKDGFFKIKISYNKKKDTKAKNIDLWQVEK